MNIEAIAQIARTHLAGKRSHDWKEIGNKYYHGQRVAKLAIALRKCIAPEDSSHDDILTVAAWFHDIDNGKPNHCALGAETTEALLEGLLSPEELEEVLAIIRVHDDRRPEHGYSLWVKLHQDADHLDHFGTFDIWTAFQYAIANDQTIEDVKDWLLSVRPDHDPRFRSELNFELSRRIFDEKAAFVTDFARRFAAECSGEIWDAQEILSEIQVG